MSKILKVVFVNGNSAISSVIKTVEELGELLHGDNNIDFIPSHCGIIIDNNFREALLSGFIGNTLCNYKPKQLRIYDLEVTNEDLIKAGDNKFKSLLGDEYSIEACIAGGIYTLFSKASKDNLVNKDNCSGNIVDIIRAYGFNILPEIAANNITPNILLTEIDKIGTQETIDQILDSYKQS